MVNTISVEGPILCLPETWLLWDVKGFEDITPHSLALLDLLDPPPEVVVVGCGNAIRVLPPALTQHLRARGIAVEALDTVSQHWSCGVFTPGQGEGGLPEGSVSVGKPLTACLRAFLTKPLSATAAPAACLCCSATPSLTSTS